MSSPNSRRRFLQAAAGGVALSGLDVGFLAQLPAVSAEEARPRENIVQMAPDIEPLVRVLEDTPREKLLEEVASRIHQGTTYREVVAALLLAGVRNVQPRPSVGFKFHAVLVVNSAHLASLASPDDQRWLPIFWALDQFKSSQAADTREGNWTMAPVDESRVPPPHKARAMFLDAMDNWDEAAADVAVASLARSAGANELFEIFSRYGARDFRSIGHKAIFVANSWRTLQMIGWQYCEPVLRSLAYALLNHEGKGNPAKNDFDADRPWRKNVELAAKIRPDWLTGKLDDKATSDLLGTLYAGSPDEACEQVVEIINRGVSPQSVWDALLNGAGELLMRQQGIVGLHTLTSSNALRYAFDTSASDDTRRMLVLQNAAFLPLFRQAMHARGKVAERRIEELQPADLPAGDEAIQAIFNSISSDRMQAARETLALAESTNDPHQFMQRARVLVFLKGRDSHDYKFSSAVLEDYFNVSPHWRNRFLATSVFHLPGNGAKDNPLVQRTRQALA